MLSLHGGDEDEDATAGAGDGRLSSLGQPPLITTPLDAEDSNDHADDLPPVSPISHLTEEALVGAEERGRDWDPYDLNSRRRSVSPLMSRSPSVLSDRQSTVSSLTKYFANHPLNIRPAPAYVAALGASQVVSEHKRTLGRRWSDDEDEDEDEEARKNDVRFADHALALVNTFLDQLLYSFLSTAKSTSLNALRPAVTEVLKSKLAREAIASAEEELAELLAGGDDEEQMDARRNAAGNDRRWDLELVWKRTRLRVMVYTRLGEMEDEDEERYINEEELFHGNDRRFSQSSGLVSWAAAIFLTSVLEFVAEQTLQIAGQAAFARARRQKNQRSSMEEAQAPTSGVLVEEYDVEKVALNSTLGRLWRTWRKAQRNSTIISSTAGHSRGVSNVSNAHSFATAHEGSVKSLHSSHPSAGTQHDLLISGQQSPGSELVYPEHVLAANIPLPCVDDQRDVDEIEVPGLAKDPDAEDDAEATLSSAKARRSTFTSESVPFFSPEELPVEVPTALVDAGSQVEQPVRPKTQRQRSMSMPSHVFRNIQLEQIPGAFPDEPHDVQNETPVPDEPQDIQHRNIEQSESLDESAQPDQKPSHLQMLTDEVSQKPTTTATVAGESSTVQVDGSEGTEKDLTSEENPESGGILAAAAAGIVAAGAGAAALMYGKKEDEHESTDLQPPPLSVVKDGTMLSAADTSDEVSEPARTTAADSTVSPPAEEVQERKSLADIKNMITATPQVKDSAQTTPKLSESEQTSGVLENSVAVASPLTSRPSTESKIPQPATPTTVLASGEEYEYSQIPMTPVSGTRVTNVTYTFHTPPQQRANSSDPEPLVKEPNSSDIRIGNPHRESPDKRVSVASTQRGSRDLDTLSQVSPVSELTPDESALSPIRPASSNRVSVSSFAQSKNLQRSVSPVESGQLPQAASVTAVTQAARQEASPQQSRKKSSEASAQESPFRHRLSSFKKTPRQSQGSPDIPIASLTSASIRGPEDFDMFVQAAETVKYTLTPETVRDDTGPASPRELPMLHNAVKQPQSPTSPRPPSYKQVTAATTPINILAETEEPARKFVKPQLRRSVSRPSAQNTKTNRKSGLMAREPRVMTESTRDFADFIRSTAPQKESTIYPVLPNASVSSLHSLRAAHINGASATASAAASAAVSRNISRSGSPGPSGERTPVTTTSRSMSGAVRVPPVPPLPAQRKTPSTMQARSATASSDGNSELIDFIRSGPDERGQHRISRTVAPFRTTMDSDQLRDLTDRSSVEQSLGQPGINGSTQSIQSSSSMKPASNRTSVNSRSALLNSGSTIAPAVQPVRGGAQTKAIENSDGKQRYRSKDPYSTDFVDEDDDDDDEEVDDRLTALPGKERQQTESLIDFLRNTDPQQVRPVSGSFSNGAVGSKPTASTSRPISVQSSRSGTAATTPGNMSPVPPGMNGPARARTMPSSTSRNPTPSVRSSTIGLGPSGASHSRLEARGSDVRASGINRTGTADLADFLKNSGPVEDPDSAPAPFVGKGPKLSPKEAEKRRKKEEKLRAKENKKSPINPTSSSGGGGFFGLGRRKTVVDVS